MALNDYEKAQIISALDELNDATKFIVLASIDAFADWLASIFYAIYLKVKSALRRLWQWLKVQIS